MLFLDDIISKTRERVERERSERPLSVLREEALNVTSTHASFFNSLSREGLSIIAEIKKASPSKGEIVSSFPYLEIAREYEASHADAISCLTEPYYFKGSDSYLSAIAKEVKLPTLRKDFVIDEYMIYQARTLGAAAVLLIVRILSDEELKRFLELACSLGLDALVETHNEREVERALKAGAKIIGINNRDLDSFHVDLNNTLRLAPMIPSGVIKIAESGIKTKDDIIALKSAHVDGLLIGESFMRSSNKASLIKEFKAL